MKCTTCQQTNFSSIHGRVFCADCGVDAANRLQAFQSQIKPPSLPPKVGSDHLLDLSQAPAQPPTPAVMPTVTATPKPPKAAAATNTSIAGLSRSQTSELTPAQPAAATPAPDVPRARSSWQPAGNPKSSNPTTTSESVMPPAPVPAAPALPATPMQPHQTYSLKEIAERSRATPNEEAIPAQPDNTANKPRHRLHNLFGGRLWRTGAIALSMLLLTGYVTYLNYPNIAVRVAANRANIEARLPGYLPQGYGFDGPVSYNPGQLTITFRGQEDKGITLTQSTTRWDSRSLLENHVKLSASTYDTYRQNGLTIYTYDDRHAAWVNSGMLYEIESETPLESGDIIKMASSL
ncbi:MAG: hypothetical protein WD467_00530 [Candidatus Saccharimonadales bacterium]